MIGTAREPAAFPRPLRTVLLALGGALGVTAAVFGTVLVLGFSLPSMRSSLLVILAAAVVVHGVLMLVMLAMVMRRCGASRASLGLVRPTWRLLHLLWQIPVALILVLAVQGVVTLTLGDDTAITSAQPGTSDADGSPVVAALFLVGGAFLAPLWEEFLFRGIVLGALRTRWGSIAAVVGSAVVFAAAHAIPILLPYLLTMGLVLAALRMFHRNLWGPLALHMTVNTIASAALIAALA